MGGNVEKDNANLEPADTLGDVNLDGEFGMPRESTSKKVNVNIDWW